MADNEISLDDDTHIRELEESESKEKSQPRPRSVVVKIPLDQLTSDSTSGSPVSSKRKKELLKRSKETDHSYSKNDTRDTDKTLELIKPLPVPDNYTIRKKTPDRSEKEERSQTSKKDSPARRRSRSRERSRGRRRSTERGRSRSPSRHRSPRRRSRSPSYRRRYSPRRSWSRNSRFSRSPRRSRSPVFRRRSPPRVFRPRDRSFSRSPVRRFTPPRWRDNRFTGPPGPPDFGNRWDSRPPRPGFSPRRQGFGPDYPSNDRNFQNFEEHCESWRSNPVNDYSLPPPILPVPVEQHKADHDKAFDSLKEEIKNISKTVLALSSKMSSCTVTSDRDLCPVVSHHSDSTRHDEVSPMVQPSVPSVSSRRNEDLQPVRTVVNNSPVVLVEKEPVEGSSSSEESSDEEQSSEDDSGDESEDSSPVQVVEGVLDWPSLVQHIIAMFPDKIGPEETSPTVNRIENLGGLVEKKESERVKLPMHAAIRKELTVLASDVKEPPCKIKAKKDTKPLARGQFPEGQRGLPVQALSDELRFNHPAQIDAEADKLLPPKKVSYAVQGRLTEEGLRKLERDLRITLSSLSYVLWSLDFATQSLVKMGESTKKEKDKEKILPIVSACRHALSFLSSSVDRSSTSLALTILTHRDSFLAQMDPLLPEEDAVKLRSASFLDTRLFAGSISDIVPKIEELRRVSHSRESVDALTSLAKKGVQNSGSKASSSKSGNNKKKSSKKFSKKKSSKKSSNEPVKQSTTTVQENSGNITRTFRSKGKKSSNK